MLQTKRTAFILSRMGWLYGFETKNIGSMRKMLRLMNGEMPDTIYGSLIICTCIADKEAEWRRPPQLPALSQAHLSSVYHCCLSDTGI